MVLYTITVTKTETVEKLTKRDWVRGGTEGRDGPSGEYGYTPQIPEIAEVTTEVCKMRVENLRLDQLVIAIIDHSDAP